MLASGRICCVEEILKAGGHAGPINPDDGERTKVLKQDKYTAEDECQRFGALLDEHASTDPAHGTERELVYIDG